MAGDIPDVYLKFHDLKGECNDKSHPGDEGWITVKSFNFGFGFTGTDGAADDDDEDQQATGSPQTGTRGGNNPNTGGTVAKKKKRKKQSAPMKSGPMSFDCITFSKNSDVMSHALMEACHKGKEIKKVELHACRYGGGATQEKVPFLVLVFEKVTLKSCKLNLATDGMPSEDVEFEYKKVEMKCMWTDNATGKPLDSQPITAGWDLAAQEEIEEDAPDPLFDN